MSARRKEASTLAVIDPDSSPRAPMFARLPLATLRESKQNPRRHFDSAALDELANSIQQHGVITPLLVRHQEDHYEIAAGARRSRAAKMAGLDAVPCIVRDMSDLEFLEVLVVENNQRENVHPLEEAQGYRALVNSGYSAGRVAEKIGRSRIYVQDRLKLLELGKAGQDLFFCDKISFAHARLLSRLPVADQAKVIGLQDVDGFPDGGLFLTEHTLLDEGDAPASVKPRSVRELSEWIDENIRLDPQAGDLPELFPETAAAIEQAAEKEEKVVRITRSYQIPETARSSDPVLTERSWKRADGAQGWDYYAQKQKKSKTCDVSVLGVIVVGEGRGESFRVCVDRDCDVHWGAEQREKAKRAKGSSSAVSAEKRQKLEAAKYQAEREKREREQVAWKKAGPAILEALAEKVGAAKGLGAIGALVIEVYAKEAQITPAERSAIRDVAPKGKTAEAILKHAALLVLGEMVFDEYSGPRQLPKMAKAFGVDVAAILKQHAPPAAKKTADK